MNYVYPFRFGPILILVVSVFAGLTSPAFGQHNFCASPTIPSCCYDGTVDGHPLEVVPSPRWDDLFPGQILGDNTGFKWGVGGCDIGSLASIWYDVAIANNIAFTAAQERVEAWNIANASAPSLRWTSAPASIYPYWLSGADTNDKIISVDAVHDPVSGKTLVGFPAKTFGFAAFFNGQTGSGLYEDAAGNAIDVYMTTIGGRAYGFVAFTDEGVIGYDLSNAANLNGVCENTQGATPNGCSGSAPGVYLNKLPGAVKAWNVGGAGNYLAGRTGQSKTLTVWNISNPSSPSLQIQDDIGFNGNGEVVMWIKGGVPFLATAIRDPTPKLKIYNLGCLNTSSCNPNSFPSPTVLNLDVGSGFKYGVRHGSIGGDPHLYVFVSNLGAGTCVVQREWIFDVSNAGNPIEINNPTTTSDSYYSWYYNECIGDPNVNGGGFKNITPTGGAFHNGYLYRTLATAFDQHTTSTTGSPPTANFTWTAPSCAGSGPSCQPFEGEEVDFSDTSSGSPPADQWSWAFPTGTPSGSTIQNPQNVVFSSPGVKAVNLDATNAFGTDNIQRNVTIRDAAPGGIEVTSNINTAMACQPVTFTATADSGVPPLTYSWSVTGPASVDPGDLSGTSTPVMTWTIDGAQAGGNYTARADVSNVHGSDFDTTIVQVLAISGPASLDQSAPTVVSTNGLQATFSVNSSQTTTWSWNFDYPSGPWEDFTDPVVGPNPTHTYADEGTYAVRVRVSNCLNPTPAESQSASVQVTDVPLSISSFNLTDFATCPPFGGCVFTVGEVINFTFDIQGTPTLYEIDWDADGTYEELVGNPGTSPVGHKYCSPVSIPFQGFQPKLRVRKNLEDPIEGSMTPIEGLTINAGGSCSLPSAPANLVATAGPSSITIDWNSASGASGYRVLRTDGSLVQGVLVWSHIATTGAGVTSYLDTAVTSGVLYTYKAYAYNGDGISGDSNSDTAETQPLVPIFSDGFESGDLSQWSSSQP